MRLTKSESFDNFFRSSSSLSIKMYWVGLILLNSFVFGNQPTNFHGSEQSSISVNPLHRQNQSLSSSLEKPKVKVEVYYETLCPDSMQFLLYQLFPNYERLKNQIELKLYPFGKAQFFESGNSFEFYCQHGPKECRGNLIHCCVLDRYRNYDESIPFLRCMENDLYGLRRPSVDAVAQKCANSTNLNWKEIDECASSNRGKQLLVEAGRKTKSLKPRLTFVPTVVINEKYSNRDQNQAVYVDFGRLIEDYRKEIKNNNN
ncbi:GILT-like protein C02D5.2 [Sarcoptes scabiei]|uniref:GILT-like protein C02D5.2 n=1 Tax=Sarcoptes scabiei TaxID=52283 RepID=A0A834RBV9_SARSC|nr:GILT-like protein C02D5.2 [Sarcoptes scabiei]